MATPERRGGGIGGISLGGILVIIGIVVALFWSRGIGLIIVLDRTDRLRRLRPGQVVLRHPLIRRAVGVGDVHPFASSPHRLTLQ